MEEMNYSGNSYKTREPREQKDDVPEKKIDKVVSNAKVKKKGIFSDFINNDIPSIWEYVGREVLVPAIKKFITEAISNGLDMLLYGETNHSSPKQRRTNASNVSYQAYYGRDKGEYNRSSFNRRYDPDSVIIDSRGEAENVLSCMDEMLGTYGVVSVADFYELCGVDSNYTDNNYGWTDIRSAQIVRTRDGYIIKLPKASPIN